MSGIAPMVWHNYDPETGTGDPSTPLTADKLNQWTSDIVLVSDAAEGYAADAAQSALDAIVPTDAAMATASDNPASLFRASMATYTPITLRGLYSARPAASSVPAGSMYFPTDVPEQYRSDGTAWEVVGSGGNEIGYAQISTNFTTTSTAYVDITGMAHTFVVGERPIIIRFDGVIGNTVANVHTFVQLVLDGTAIAAANTRETVASGYRGVSRTQRVSGLTPGSTHTVKAQALTAATGTAQVYGNTAALSAITVATV